MSAGGITELLIKWSDGDKSALDELIPLVYDELRRLASSYLRRERREHTLQSTALIHEAYCRLVKQQDLTWQNRAQFFGMAATVMRNILVDHARQHRALKRGGAQFRLSLTQGDKFASKPDVDLIALDQALEGLAKLKPQYSKIVELRFFGGLTIEETAAALGVSHATIERDWKFARAWLRREMRA